MPIISLRERESRDTGVISNLGKNWPPSGKFSVPNDEEFFFKYWKQSYIE